MFIGGPVKEVSFNGRTFQVAEDADVTIDLGGYSNEVQMNGDGSVRVIKTRKPGAIEAVSVAIDRERQDQEFLQSISNGTELTDTSITFVDGSVYYGQSILTGDLKVNSKDCKAEVAFMGKTFKKQ